MGDRSSNRFDCSLLLSLNAVGKRQEVIIDRLVQCREKMKQLTKICWHLIAFPSTPDFLGAVGLNLALALVTFSCCHKTAVGWGEVHEHGVPP